MIKNSNRTGFMKESKKHAFPMINMAGKQS